MTFGAHIEVRDIESLTHYLGEMKDRVQDFSVPLTDGVELILTDVLAAFNTAGASIGISWPRHAQGTLSRWGEHSFGQGPTGNLLGSVRPFVRPFVAGVEATAPHAHLFENGRSMPTSVMTRGGRVKVRKRTAAPPTSGEKTQPGREFLLITNEREEQICTLILDYAVKE